MDDAESEASLVPLKAVAKAGGLSSSEDVFWLRELKDPSSSSTPWSAWDGASAGERMGAAKWIRSWDDEALVEHARETVGAITAMMRECFEEDLEWPVRWAAEVVLDVFGEKEDIAASVEMFRRPTFAQRRIDFDQFDRLEGFVDLWLEGGRAEELLDRIEKDATLDDGFVVRDVHVVLTRWIVASSLAELLYSSNNTTTTTNVEAATAAVEADGATARDELLSKAAVMRRAVEDEDEDDDDDDEWDEEVDVPDVEVASETKKTSPLLPQPPQKAGKAKTEVGSYYSENDAERVRHDKGYDVLDKAMAKLSTDENRRSAARQLFVEYVAAMFEKGLAFDLAFESESLGIAVSLAKFGDKGRPFVTVDKSSDPRLLPGDELAAINGAYVVDPSEKSIELVKTTIKESPRPLVITFIRGEQLEDDRNITSTPVLKKEQPRLLSARDVNGTLKLVVRPDGQVRKVREYFYGNQRVRKEMSKQVATCSEKDRSIKTSEKKGGVFGYARGQGPIVDLVVDDRVAGYVDLSNGRVLDATQSTRFQVLPTGTVKRADGLECGIIDDFHYSQLVTLGLVLTFLDPDLFALPNNMPKNGIVRSFRKQSSKLTGMHGYFG